MILIFQALLVGILFTILILLALLTIPIGLLLAKAKAGYYKRLIEKGRHSDERV